MFYIIVKMYNNACLVGQSILIIKNG